MLTVACDCECEIILDMPAQFGSFRVSLGEPVCGCIATAKIVSLELFQLTNHGGEL